MPRTDRIWRGRSVFVGVGPLVVPSRSAMVGAVLALAAGGPTTRVGLRFDPSSPKHWLYQCDDLESWVDSCVVQLPGGADDDVDALLTRLGTEPVGDRALVVYLADRHVFLRLDHALTDGPLSAALPTDLVSIALGGDLPRWTTLPVLTDPLRAALRAKFSNPRSMRAVLSEWRGERAAHAALAHDPSGADGAAAATRPFFAEPVTVHETGSAGRTRVMQEWTRRHTPGAAPFATVLTCVHQALQDNGVRTVPGVHLLYDLRRYLPRNRHLSGNFTIGVNTPVDLADPARLTAAAARSTQSGRPLLSLSASTALVTAAESWPSRLPADIAAEPRAHLAYSYLGTKRLAEALPWLADPVERRLWARGDPAGATGITLFVVIVNRCLTISASFHATAFDPAAVRAALRAVHDDPIGLLSRSLNT